MTVTGTAKDFSMSAGSCFKINYAQPYVKSLSDYNREKDAASDTWDPFYTPFPDSSSLSVSGTASTISSLDDYTVLVTLSSEATSFNFEITGFVNPYSQVRDSATQASVFKVEHFGDNCDLAAVATACNPDTCTDTAPGFTPPSSSSFGTPTSEISHTSGINYVGGSDGDITFNLLAGTNFPKYGGKITLTLPNWYVVGNDWTPVFTPGKTLCESDSLDIRA